MARRIWLPGDDSDDRAQWEAAAGQQSSLPSDVSAVSAWLRLALGTVTGSGYASVPDVLASNPATQGTDAQRPVNTTAGNGLPTATFTDDYLDWPLATGNNGATKWGVAFWMNSTADGTVRRIISVRRTGASGGASVDKLEVCYQTGRGLMFDCYASDGQAYRCRSDTVATGLHFWTVEGDFTLATDALKTVITLDGTPLTCSFETAAGVQAAMPSSLPQPTGSIYIGALTTVPAFPFTGILGPNLYILNRQLTAGERTALRTFEAPT